MSSGEDLAANLRNYQIQLQQVDAALTNDSSNEELLKLKNDLQEVIQLTKNLMAAEGLLKEEDDGEEETDKIYNGSEVKHNFQCGDMVLAPWSEDGQFYEAAIEDIMSDGQCNLIFNNLPSGKSKVSEVCLVTLLKPLPGSRKKMKMDSSGSGAMARQGLKGNKSGQYSKKKQQKKQSRVKQLEEEREKEKSKWQQFNEKAGNKHLKGATTLLKKQSIFKSPETVTGKVGVGTCGIAGKPMTDFVVADKYKRGKSITDPSTSTSSASRYPNLHSLSTLHQHKYK